MSERDCMTCGTIGCGHQDARRCGVMFAEWTPKKTAVCNTCENRGRIDGLSQETICEHCIWQGQQWRTDRYSRKQKIIRDCIANLQGRPGRNAIRSLKGMLVAEQEQQKQTKPAADHPWRIDGKCKP